MEKRDIFSIEWNEEIPNSNVTPASEIEIIAAMMVINEKAKVAEPGTVVSARMRSEVADALKQSINSTGSGAAAVNIGEDKLFDANKGIFISWLYVAKDDTILNNYIDNF